MGRRIQTKDLMSVGGSGADSPVDRMVKYVPADAIALWALVESIIAAATGGAIGAAQWVVFVIITILTPLWTWKQTTEPNKKPAWTQIVISILAFIVWVFAIGGPFKTLAWYQQWYGTLVAAICTAIFGFIVPSEK